MMFENLTIISAIVVFGIIGIGILFIIGLDKA